MTREYLVVYEKGANNWSALSPDLPGCGSLGDALEDTRTNMREAMELYLVETAKAGEPFPEATATKVDFDEFDPGHKTKLYFVEWLQVSLPHSLQGTAKSRHPEYTAVKVFLRRETHKVAARKWEDAEGGDFSDLVEQLLQRYLAI